MASPSIALTLTPAATEALRRIMEPIAHLKPAARLIWTPAVGQSADSARGPGGWMLAFDPIDRVSSQQGLMVIDGVQFYFDVDWCAEGLDGKTLDYRGGTFFLNGEALAI